jgi:hypothetical protein
VSRFPFNDSFVTIAVCELDLDRTLVEDLGGFFAFERITSSHQ